MRVELYFIRTTCHKYGKVSNAVKTTELRLLMTRRENIKYDTKVIYTTDMYSST